MKFLKFSTFALLVLTLILWLSFVIVRHSDGDIIFVRPAELVIPEVREVCFGIPHPKNGCMLDNQNYWLGGDVMNGTQPSWVLLIPCFICNEQIGGDWYGGGEYSRWIPKF
jgi:hypothetical protein